MYCARAHVNKIVCGIGGRQRRTREWETVSGGAFTYDLYMRIMGATLKQGHVRVVDAVILCLSRYIVSNNGKVVWKLCNIILVVGMCPKNERKNVIRRSRLGFGNAPHQHVLRVSSVCMCLWVCSVFAFIASLNVYGEVELCCLYRKEAFLSNFHNSEKYSERESTSLSINWNSVWGKKIV